MGYTLVLRKDVIQSSSLNSFAIFKKPKDLYTLYAFKVIEVKKARWIKKRKEKKVEAKS